MGLRFRKSLRIAPGVRLNFTQRGVSTTVGPRGASINLGSSGARGNVGIPGTGLSYSQRLSGSGGGSSGSSNQASQGGCGLLAVIGFIVLLIGMCSKSDNGSTSGSTSAMSGGSSEAVAAETRYVSARALNCRAGPSTSGAVVAGLVQNDAVEVAEQSGTWSKLRRPAGDCWVASSFLAAAPVIAAQGLMSTRTDTGGDLRASSSGAVSRATASPLRKSRSKRSSRTYLDGSCPCSGAHVCIGPRGGRYCITSGGNKRYGV